MHSCNTVVKYIVHLYMLQYSSSDHWIRSRSMHSYTWTKPLTEVMCGILHSVDHKTQEFSTNSSDTRLILRLASLLTLPLHSSRKPVKSVSKLTQILLHTQLPFLQRISTVPMKGPECSQLFNFINCLYGPLQKFSVFKICIFFLSKWMSPP